MPVKARGIFSPLVKVTFQVEGADFLCADPSPDLLMGTAASCSAEDDEDPICGWDGGCGEIPGDGRRRDLHLSSNARIASGKQRLPVLARTALGFLHAATDSAGVRITLQVTLFVQTQTPELDHRWVILVAIINHSCFAREVDHREGVLHLRVPPSKPPLKNNEPLVLGGHREGVLQEDLKYLSQLCVP